MFIAASSDALVARSNSKLRWVGCSTQLMARESRTCTPQNQTFVLAQDTPVLALETEAHIVE